MNRVEFEALRDFPGKAIANDIRFSKRQATLPAVVAEGIAISNTAGVDLRLNITYNVEIGSKTFNVHIPGVGPICRLDIDGPKHLPAGRSHKHSLSSERCPDRNLPDGVVDRSDLSGKSVRELSTFSVKLAKSLLAACSKRRISNHDRPCQRTKSSEGAQPRAKHRHASEGARSA